MIKRIDLFMPTSSQYGALHYFTEKFHEAFMRCGVHSRLLVMEESNPQNFLTQLLNDPPDCTLSFNGVLPAEGRFLCDLIKTPHIACLVDTPLRFMPLTKSPYNIITCIDQFFCEIFQEIPFDNVLLMPLAVEKDLDFDAAGKRDYDVLLLASYLDHEEVARRWEEKYSSGMCHALLSAAEITLVDQSHSYEQILIKCIEQETGLSKNDIFDHFPMQELFSDFEIYIRGFERVRLVKSIGQSRIDIFGEGNTQAIWDRHLGTNHNVVVHEAVPYSQTLELMKRAKIVLNSCAWIKNGAHDRIFAAMACGAVVLTGENLYLKKYFVGGESILFFNGNAMMTLEGTVSAILKDEHTWQRIAKKGREITMQHHTWDQRVALLISSLDTR